MSNGNGNGNGPGNGRPQGEPWSDPWSEGPGNGNGNGNGKGRGNGGVPEGLEDGLGADFEGGLDGEPLVDDGLESAPAGGEGGDGTGGGSDDGLDDGLGGGLGGDGSGGDGLGGDPLLAGDPLLEGDPSGDGGTTGSGDATGFDSDGTSFLDDREGTGSGFTTSNEDDLLLSAISGTAGGGRIDGTGDNEGLGGTDGDDEIRGRGGDDILDGGQGNDTIIGDVLDTEVDLQDPDAAEFRLNDFTHSRQEDPAVAGLVGNRFAVAWESNGQDGNGRGIFGKVLDDTGTEIRGEFRINAETRHHQESPEIAGLQDGGFVVVWHSRNQDDQGQGVFAARFDADGNPVGGETVRLDEAIAATPGTAFSLPYAGGDAGVDDTGLRLTSMGEIEAADDEDYNVWRLRNATDEERVVVLEPYGGGAGTTYTLAPNSETFVATHEDSGDTYRLFHDGGLIDTKAAGDRDFSYGAQVPGGEAEFQVNTTERGDQQEPDVAGLADGGFVIVWESRNVDGNDFGIAGQRYGADGNPVGEEFVVNAGAETKGAQTEAAVAGLADGGFVVTWTDSRDDGIWQQRYDAEGQTLGGAAQVYGEDRGSTEESDVAALDDGGWIVVWSAHDGSSSGVYQQRYDADGQAVGSPDRVNQTDEGNQEEPRVAALADGGWAVTWESANVDGSGEAAMARRYTAEGEAWTDELVVNDTTKSEQDDVAVGVSGEGDVLIAWEIEGSYDGSASAVLAKIFNAGGNVPGNDQIAGGVGDDNVFGGFGSDTLDGGEGADALYGGGDDDIIIWDPADRTINAGTGQDTLVASGGNDEIWLDDLIFTNERDPDSPYNGGLEAIDLGDGDDLVVGDRAAVGEAPLTVYGGAGVDSIALWGTGDDTVDGGTDTDSIWAGDGADTVMGGAGTDFLYGGAGNDLLMGGDDFDIYYFGRGDDRDTIVDTSPGGNGLVMFYGYNDWTTYRGVDSATTDFAYEVADPNDPANTTQVTLTLNDADGDGQSDGSVTFLGGQITVLNFWHQPNGDQTGTLPWGRDIQIQSFVWDPENGVFVAG